MIAKSSTSYLLLVFTFHHLKTSDQKAEMVGQLTSMCIKVSFSPHEQQSGSRGFSFGEASIRVVECCGLF